MGEKEKIRDIAIESIKYLFELAKASFRERPDLAQRFVGIAVKIAMRTRISIPKENRLLVCRYCKKFIFPGVSSRVRIQPKRTPHLVITCLYCGKHMRRPLKRRRELCKLAGSSGASRFNI